MTRDLPQSPVGGEVLAMSATDSLSQPLPARLSGQVFKMREHLSSPRFNGAVTGALHARRASAEYVDGSVHVRIGAVSAIDALKDRLALATFGVDGTAGRARLRGIGGVHVVQHAAPIGELVFQHLGEHRPTLLKNGAVQATLSTSGARHIRRIQFLDRHLTEPFGDVCRLLMQPVAARVRRFGEQPGCGSFGVSTAPGAPLTSRQDTLGGHSLTVQSGNVGRKVFCRAGGQAETLRNTAVNADCPITYCAGRLLAFSSYAGEPTDRRFLDRNGQYSPGRRSRQSQLNNEPLRQRKSRPFSVDGGQVAFRALNPKSDMFVFGTEAREAAETKECSESKIHIAQGVILGATGRIRKPPASGTHFSQLAGLACEANQPTCGGAKLAPPVPPLLQGYIVHETRRAGPFKQALLLLWRWVDSVAKSPRAHANIIAKSHVDAMIRTPSA